jgi:hypothetical protein
MNAKKKESKVTGSVAVELSPANLKGKKKESKVSEQTPTGCLWNSTSPIRARKTVR